MASIRNAKWNVYTVCLKRESDGNDVFFALTNAQDHVVHRCHYMSHSVEGKKKWRLGSIRSADQKTNSMYA